MKILQAFDFLSLPHGSGTVDIVYKLSKALAERGHEITICTGDYEVDYEYLSGLGDVGIKMYHSYFNKHGIYLTPSLTGLNVRDYDVIHLHCYRSIQNVILAQKAIKHGVPYIIDAHGSTVARSGRKTLLLDTYDKLAGKRLIENAKFVIAETDVGIAEWEKLGASRDKIRLQHPLLDTSEFDMLPKAGMFRSIYGLGDSFIVLFIGRLHQAKGIETLVDATLQLKAMGSNIQLVIVGQDDGYKESLIRRVAEDRISDRVLFTGFLEGTDKVSALTDANVLVQPSKNEAGARPSLEAIMCGTPVIVSKDTGAGRELAKFDGGLLFEYGNLNSLADSIQEIIDYPEDARVRTKWAKVYIKEDLSLYKQVGEYEELYQEVMK